MLRLTCSIPIARSIKSRVSTLKLKQKKPTHAVGFFVSSRRLVQTTTGTRPSAHYSAHRWLVVLATKQVK